MTADGHRHELGRDDRMLERLDLAYAVNVHIAQGMTAENGIVLINEREKALNTTQSFLVGVTRIADQAMPVVDNVKTPERDVTRNPGGKTRAIETGLSPSNDKPELPVSKIERRFHLEQAGLPARIFLCPPKRIQF
ncbi:hypothetical protein [Sphingobium sp. R-21]|uniref:hypothetical protein n=1 Tax=Sphingobium sp. R-21 TaxID=3404056 RepID=UPI003CFAC151